MFTIIYATLNNMYNGVANTYNHTYWNNLLLVASFSSHLCSAKITCDAVMLPEIAHC